jgi:hypothetical protein
LATDRSSQANLLTSVLVPLFRWVTHPRVVDSSVLEQEVSIIFNYMLGVGGARMAALFNFVTDMIEAWSDLDVTGLTLPEIVELSLNVLSKNR